MSKAEIFINKVEASGIIAFDLIDYKPRVEVVGFDIKPLLFMELIVKEKEFRAALNAIDFSVFNGKAVAIYCSADAIVPPCVYMLLATKLHRNAIHFDFKETETLYIDLWKSNVERAALSSFKNKKVVVRARPDIPPDMYLVATKCLQPMVSALMYGEVGMPKVIFK